MARVLQTYGPMITQPFGNNHIGMDLVGYLNGTGVLDNILCVYDGVVENMESNCADVYSDYYSAVEKWGHSYGCYVLVDHGYINGHSYKTRYAHLQYQSNSHLYVGAKINKGDVIGYMGNTGHTHGGHLHFELIKDGNVINPYDLLFGNLELNELDKPIIVMPSVVERNEEVNQFEVIYSDLNVREKPSIDSNVIYYPCPIGIYNVIEVKDKWYKIADNMWINIVGGKYYPAITKKVKNNGFFKKIINYFMNFIKKFFNK